MYRPTAALIETSVEDSLGHALHARREALRCLREDSQANERAVWLIVLDE